MVTMSDVLSCLVLRIVTMASLAGQATPVRVPRLITLATSRLANGQVEPVHVIVSRREARVVFPRDTARAWGWSDRTDPGYIAGYAWGMTVTGMDGPRTLVASVARLKDEARDFPSLEALVAAARASLCLPGMLPNCSDSSTHVAVENGRVVLTLRDSARIARLFGLRPTSVDVWQQRPEDAYRYSRDTAIVEYVAPQIPLPDAATRADAARSQRRYEASVSRIMRYIAGGTNWKPLWLEVGDSASVSVAEMRCHHDVCSSGYAPTDSGWTIVDSRIARVYVPKPDTRTDVIVIVGTSRPYVKALRPGRTVLRVRGLRSPSDTAPSSEPPERQLEREVIVTPPIERVEITPRPDTMRVDEIVRLRVRVLDRGGREVAGLPWRLEVLDGPDRSIRLGPEMAPTAFTAPGRIRIAASLGGHADTVTVTVIAPR